MIKPGYTLYATFADGEWFVKQAKSPAQFVRLCVEDQKAHGYVVPPRGRHWYEPDVFYDEKRQAWYDAKSGEFWHRKLPEWVKPRR
jgi:hypothetical protein